jgi:hypothetical protein
MFAKSDLCLLDCFYFAGSWNNLQQLAVFGRLSFDVPGNGFPGKGRRIGVASLLWKTVC